MTEIKPVRIVVKEVVAKILGQLSRTLETSSTRAVLANLRNSLGRKLETTVEVWPLIYEHLPEEFLSKAGKLTAEERAIMTTLQLYAIHQQGSTVTVNEADWKKVGNLGSSLKTLRIASDNTKAIDRRFNAMITASTYAELENHLRYLIKLLKSNVKTKGVVRINYAQLASDLFWYQLGYGQSMKLNWGRSYYSQVNSPKEEKNNEE